MGIEIARLFFPPEKRFWGPFHQISERRRSTPEKFADVAAQSARKSFG